MTSPQTSPVVSAAWLKDALDSGGTNVRVLDASWSSTADKHSEYLKKHIPGSLHLDIMYKVVNTDLYPRNLPAPEAFGQQVCSLGINPDTHVVVYDNTGQGGFFIAGRAWWMFKLFGHEKVSVLNGGLAAWESEGFETTMEVPTVKEGSYKASLSSKYIKRHKEMKENLTTKDFTVLDSRASSKYCGDKDDPLSGHYPGATSVPFHSKLLTEDQHYIRIQQDLRKMFEEEGVNLGSPLVTMCNSGMSSCTLALVCYWLGAPSVSVYHGGFTEWSKLDSKGNIEQSET